jgi:hypothetical protein
MTTKVPLPTNYLIRIFHPEIKDFTFSFRPAHVFTWTSSRHLEIPILATASSAPYLLNRYAQYDDTPLWWGCIGEGGTPSSKRTVRSWLARRGRIAFTESLRKQGWDKEGRVLAELRGDERKNLFGTAFIFAKLQGVKTTPKELGRQMDIAVLQMMKMVKKAEDKKLSGDKATINKKGK